MAQNPSIAYYLFDLYLFIEDTFCQALSTQGLLFPFRPGCLYHIFMRDKNQLGGELIGEKAAN